MKTKQEIVENWLPRYTKRPLEQFTKHILLTNFTRYVEIFADYFKVPILGQDGNMPNASAEGITIINFGMGSANAATIMDLLSAVEPEAVLFLGKCGGIKKINKLGDYILPIAAIRGEGTSNDYFPPEVPSLPAFNLLCLQIFGISIVIIGLELFILPIVAFGSMMTNSKTIFVRSEQWLLIWKQRLCLLADLPIKFLPEHFCWYRISL